MKSEQIKTIQSVTRELVMRALGWDMLQYGHFVFDKGIEYLENYCGNDAEVVSQFSQKPLFWQWYRNHWHNRDAAFLKNTKGMSQAQKLREYHDAHNMKGFRYKPHSVIMERTMYAEVIEPCTHEKGVCV